MATEDVLRRGDRPGRRGKRLRAAVIGIVLAGYAWAAGAAAPFSMTSLVYVVIPGLILAAIACWWPLERIPPPGKLDITGVSYWAIAVAALFEWEASAWKDRSWPWHPSLTDLINPLLGPHIVKSAAILLWILVGWAVVRR